VQFTSTPKAKFSNNKQFLAGVVTYDAFDSTQWTARFTGVSAGDQTIARASTPEVSVKDALDTATTLFDIGARLTPLPNCTQPVRRNAVTATTATGSARADVVSSATVAGGTLNAKGLAQPGVTAVSVTVDDANPDTAPVIAPASVSPSGAWAASVAGGQLAGLDDGALTVAANYTLASGTVAGVNGGIAKDTVAPAAPASTLAPGSYVGAQSTTLSSDADATIRYTTDGSTPTATSAKAAGALSVAASQTVKAVAFDAAGNASAVSTFAFTITAPAVVTPPAAGTPSTPIGTGTGTGAGAPTPQAPVIVVPSTGSTTPARRTLRFASLSVAKTIKLAAARKGVKVTMVLPAGASRVDYTLRRGSKLVRSGRALHGAGRAVLRLKVAQRGSYRLTLKLRGSAAGQQKVVTFRVV